MTAVIIIICLIVPLFWFYKKIIAKTRTTVHLFDRILAGKTNDFEPVLHKSEKVPDSKSIAIEDKQLLQIINWQEMDTLQQLKLVLLLVQHALPVWEAFVKKDIDVDESSSPGFTMPLEAGLLQLTMSELNLASSTMLPAADAILLNRYNKFITLVIAMRDAVWHPPYPVKKIILSVFYMLKTVVEQHSNIQPPHSLQTAMIEVIDCLELSKLYTPVEIEVLIKNYLTKRMPLP